MTAGRSGADDCGPQPAQRRGGGAWVAVLASDLTQELLAADWWTEAMLAAAGIPVVDVPFVTVGGGMGASSWWIT